MDDQSRNLKVAALTGAALGAGVALGVGLRMVVWGAAFGLGVGLALSAASDARRRLVAPEARPDDEAGGERAFDLAGEAYPVPPG